MPTMNLTLQDIASIRSEKHKRSIRMNWVRAIVGVLVLWSSAAWGATLTWNANNEPDLAGYRVYQIGETQEEYPYELGESHRWCSCVVVECCMGCHVDVECQQ